MIRWFINNGVAANLLAAILIIAGLFTAFSIKLELFPELELDLVSINVAYPGAAPEEIESGVIELIENKIQAIEGIKKVTAVAAEGFAALTVEVARGYDASQISDQIKERINTIDSFPEQAKRPAIKKVNIRNEVISLAIYGAAEPTVLKAVAEYVRDELNTRADITQVDINGIADFQISINVSEAKLRRYDLSFEQVADAVRRSSVDIPGGSLKSNGGEILLRTSGKAYQAEAFERIPLLTTADGATVALGDVAQIIDGFVDDPIISEFNQQRAVLLRIFALGDQSALDVSARVQEFAAEMQNQMPAGIQIETFRDFTYYLKGRLQMLLSNGTYGLILVFLILTLFLRPSLAFFVMLGIPISFLGSLLVLPPLGISINLASLFGFILVLGIVVDDAIIVGESVFTEFQKNDASRIKAALRGTKKVSIPVTFAVLTTVVAFLPILTLPGFLGKFFYPIPVVVIACLILSLIESKLILPYHLTLCKVSNCDHQNLSWLNRQQRKIADGLEYFILHYYTPVLKQAIRFRYTTAAAFVGTLIVTLGILAGKHLPFVFFPVVPSDYIVAKLVMPPGTPVELTQLAIEKMQAGLKQLIVETEAEGLANPFDNAVVTIGAQPFDGSAGPMGSTILSNQANLAEIAVELIKREDLIAGGRHQGLSSPHLAKRWRELIGPIAGAQELTFNANAAGGVGAPINIQLAGHDFDQLQAAASAIKLKLATFQGLFDIKDNYSSGKREIQLNIKASAHNLGLRQSDLGAQVRAAFYGIEAQRIQRGRDDVKVMVRYPPAERSSVENLQQLRIRTPNGNQVPFNEVADFKITQSFSAITRVDRRRVLNITADADKGIAELDLIKANLAGPSNAAANGDLKLQTEQLGLIDHILEQYPGITWTFEGEAREQAEIFQSLLKMTLIAFFIIYALLAIPLKSYIQPFVVMIVIPFGLIGAIAGHVIMGQPMSILSVLGFVALTGVVVNDSLVLVDFVNQERKAGQPLRLAITNAGNQRFRPIILTSLTTFAGLLPLLFETSLQAQFLIPMAISLSFGVLFATLITLLLVPAFYTILEDLREFGIRFFKNP
jgi:multidrug efflux pump subunit AcrB